eukprot:TRINITY_DN18845_c0_g1_i1.p1 TRINITY_DN18845_c0_g1~~TRINITY_DN18845_c0_g1_i1.p1  ORF type:complete len:113 (+),score=25.53 TRINITY_DN18845_c0_g1_i1:15-353(+)
MSVLYALSRRRCSPSAMPSILKASVAAAAGCFLPSADAYAAGAIARMERSPTFLDRVAGQTSEDAPPSPAEEAAVDEAFAAAALDVHQAWADASKELEAALEKSQVVAYSPA